MKKIFSLFISFVMILTAVFCVDITAFAQTEWSSGDVKVILNGNTITVSGKGAMADYTGNTDVNKQWRNSVTTVTKLVIENGVTSIGNFAFSSMFALESVSIPNTVTRIGEKAFFSDRMITSFNIPASVTSIGSDALRTASTSFESNLIEIVVDANNKSYSSQGGILYDKAKTKLMLIPSANPINDLTVADTIISIDAYAAVKCVNLKQITLGKNVNSIGSNAFDGCSNLEKIKIGEKVNSIGSNAFDGCSNLVEIVVDANNVNYSSQSGILYDKAKTKLMLIPSANPINDLTVADTIISIDAYAAVKCVNLKQVTLGENVNSIGSNAFAGCSNLEKITIKNNTCTIPVDAIPTNKNLVISANTDSNARIFAEKYGFVFEALDAPVLPPETEHIWDDGVITIPATCTQSGEIVYTCLNVDCTETATAVIPQTEHTVVIDKAVDATCTENGKSQGTHCAVCNSVITAQETVFAAGHNYKITTTVNPTCKKDGYNNYRCEYCGESYTEIIPSAGHNYDNGKITKQATCTATGVRTYTCRECKATKTEAIAKKKHTYKNVIQKKATTKENGKIESKCTACGNISKTTVIYYPKTVTLSKSSYVYDGKAKQPSVTVKDSKGKKIDKKYYDVKYSSNKAVGKATVTITFKGNYKGTLKKTFTIKPKSTSISKLTAGKKKFTVKWKKQSNKTTGYQIQYSTDKNFKKNNKTVAIKKNKTTSKTISKLKAKKKYYVRVRTYKTVNGKKIYSAWSKAKAVTTKK